ncbi:hypothetical protein MASR2M15_03480 [Anaerolineales bacterium]
MTEISLQEYLQQVDDLLHEQAFDAVILHSRHILQHYPKNGAAYRALGSALIINSRWEEALEVFQRYLGAYPNDQLAHEALSKAYQSLGEPTRAIWHLERAYDVEPNNKEYVSRLKSLYQEYHGIQLRRIQLSVGAVARQYIYNKLYQQATHLLESSLRNKASRVDWRVQLASAYWLNGDFTEAAEEAMTILEKLPYCLNANHIMTDFWVQHRRPTDAQRYLSRVQEIDPYLAIRIATDRDPDPDLFLLPLLNYQISAQQEMSRIEPAWLDVLEEEQPDFEDDFDFDEEASEELESFDEFDQVEEVEPVEMDWLDEIPTGGFEPVETPSTGKKVTDGLSNLIDEDSWLSIADDLILDSANEVVDLETQEIPEDLLNELDAIQLASEGPTIESADAIPQDLLDSLAELENTSEDKTLVGNSPAGLLGALEHAEEIPEDEDGWLQEIEASSWTDSLTGDTVHVDTGFPELDLTDSDDDYQEVEDLFSDLEEPAPKKASIHPDDPDAWLMNSGIETDQSAPSRNLPTSMVDTNDPIAISVDQNSLGWLDSDHLDRNEEDPPALFDDEAPQSDHLSWLSTDDLAGEADLEHLEKFNEATDKIGNLAQEDDQNWMEDESVLEELLAIGRLTSEDDLDLPDDDSDDNIEITDQLGQPTANADERALFDEDFPEDESLLFQEGNTDWSWMDEQPTKNQADLPDWLETDELVDRKPASAADAEEGEIQMEENNSLDWSDSDENDDDLFADFNASDESDDWLDDDDEELPDWLSPDTADVETVEDPSWLQQVSTEKPTSLSADDLELDDFDLDASESIDLELDDEELPDWMTVLSSQDPSQMADDFEEPDDLEFNAESFFDSEQDEEALADDEIPDWMTDDPNDDVLKHTMAQAEQVGDDFFFDDEDEDDQQAANIGESIDWMLEDDEDDDILGHDLQPAVSLEAETDDDDDDFFFDDEDEEDEDEESLAAIADMPDWLLDDEANDEVFEDTMAQAEAAGDDFFFDEEDEEEDDRAEELIAGLAGMSLAGERALDALDEDFAERSMEDVLAEDVDIPDWMNDLDEESLDEESLDETPTYGTTTVLPELANMQGWEQEEGVLEEDEFSDESDSLDTDEFDLEPASSSRYDAVSHPSDESLFDEFADAPEWADEDQIEFVDDRLIPEPSWMAELTEEDLYADNDLDWAEDEAEAEPQSTGASAYAEPETLMDEADFDDLFAEPLPLDSLDSDSEFDPWTDEGDDLGALPVIEDDFLNADTVEGEAATVQELAPAENAPDWLNAMVPGLDVDFEAGEDDPVEESFESAAYHRERVSHPTEVEDEFAWLMDIVVEETQGMKPIDENEIRAESARTPEPKPTTKGFTFKKRPPWMRN